MAGFLKKLLKRKAGGTALGNTFRKILNKASGGILGNGLFMKQGKTEDAEVKKQAKAAENVQAITKNAALLADELTGQPVESQAVKAAGGGVKTWLSNNKVIVAVVGAAAAVAGILYFKNKKR